MTRVDTFVTEVVRNALSSVAEEMTMVVVRAARSPALREAGDLSSAIADGNGNLIAQGKDLPIHLGVMTRTAVALIEAVGRDALQPGDVWIVNLPETGGNHLPDVKVIRPIFHGGKLAAFAISLAHWADVGGASPGSYYAAATDLWQEGLQIPPVKILRNDQLVEDVISLILRNARGSEDRKGDLLAQVAAVRVADRRITEIVSRFGGTVFEGAVADMLDATEQQMRRAISTIPSGRYAGVDWLDGVAMDNGQVKIAVDIEVDRDSISFDFSGSDDAVRAPVNTTPSVVMAAVDFVLKMLAGESIYNTSGNFRAVKVTARKGSVLDPAQNEPVAAGNHETSQRIVDSILNALGDVIPDRICAGGCATAGLTIFSGRFEDGKWWTLYETHGGGEGGNQHRDGSSATRVYLSNMMNTPAEFIEAAYPIKVLRSEVRHGSGGNGKHRGGDGLVREYEVLAEEAHFTAIYDRRLTAPKGLVGGAPGRTFIVTINRNGEEWVVPSIWNGRLERGDSVRVETAGGGGWGTPEN